MEDNYFKESYDCIIIGGALAGLACGLTLANRKKNVLILEQHNLPGGVATSFSRGGVELEASLHEMLSVGSVESPLQIREFFNKMGVNVNWLRVNEAYRLVTPDIDCVVRVGENGDFTIPATDIASACGENRKNGPIYRKLMKFFNLCNNVNNSLNYISNHKVNNEQLLLKHNDYLRTIGYSVDEVLATFELPKKATDILKAYWLYLGSPTSSLPFTIYSVVVAEYYGYGSYIPKDYSFEMSLKMAERFTELGGEIEYGIHVNKILVENKKVIGVKLDNGTIIKSNYVICGAYPNTVYSQMIEPKEEVPKEAFKCLNSYDLGVTCFSVIMVLDKPYNELGITNYSTFYEPHGMDLDKIWEDSYSDKPFNFLTCVCPNVVNSEASPSGTCVYSITYLPKAEAFYNVTVDNYEEIKYKHANYFIETESKRLGVNLKDHIKEMVIETPITIAHYTNSYQGCIYGYRHTMDNHIVARMQMNNSERYIYGLAFAGAHALTGDGMTPSINSGRKAALEVMTMMIGGAKR